MIKYPNVSVKIIFKYKNEMLILKHKNGVFDFPGGRIEWGESPISALKRELKEELDYSLKKEPKLFDVWSYISRNNRRHSIFIYYLNRLSKKPNFSSPERNEIIWLTKRDTELMNIIKNKKFLNKVFEH